LRNCIHPSIQKKVVGPGRNASITQDKLFDGLVLDLLQDILFIRTNLNAMASIVLDIISPMMMVWFADWHSTFTGGAIRSPCTVDEKLMAKNTEVILDVKDIA